MAHMLGAAGFAGTGCSPRCRRTHTPRPKHTAKVMRLREHADWRRDWADDVDYSWYERNSAILIDLGLIS